MPCPICSVCDGPYPGPPRSGIVVRQEVRGSMKAEKRMYLTSDGTVVDEGHPDAAFLLAAEGQEIPNEEAERYGLLSGDAQAMMLPFDPAHAEYREQNEAYQTLLATPEKQAELASLRDDAERNEFNMRLGEEAAGSVSSSRAQRRSATAAPAAEAKPADAPAEAKMQAGPPENKAGAASARKADEAK